jgi:hypothetical protein
MSKKLLKYYMGDKKNLILKFITPTFVEGISFKKPMKLFKMMPKEGGEPI